MYLWLHFQFIPPTIDVFVCGAILSENDPIRSFFDVPFVRESGGVRAVNKLNQTICGTRALQASVNILPEADRPSVRIATKSKIWFGNLTNRFEHFQLCDHSIFDQQVLTGKKKRENSVICYLPHFLYHFFVCAVFAFVRGFHFNQYNNFYYDFDSQFSE